MLLADEYLFDSRCSNEKDSCRSIVRKFDKKFEQRFYLPVLFRCYHSILNFVYQQQSDMVRHAQYFHLGRNGRTCSVAKISQLIIVVRPNCTI